MDIPRKIRLTNKLCRELPFATVGQYVVRDATVPGFLCVVGARTRTYTLQLDVTVLGERKTVKRAIGSVFHFDASAALQEAQRLSAEIRAEKAKFTSRQSVLTLRQAWIDYAKRLEARVATGERSQRTLDGYRDYIERCLSNWLDVPLREIGERPEMIAEHHEQLTRECGPYQANRTMTTLRIVYNNALKRRLDAGLSPLNPVAAVDFNREERRSTGMSPLKLRAWAEQLAKLPNQVRREFHFFMLLSAMRPDALKKVRWEHLDVKGKMLRVPSPKGGAKRAFDLPLSGAMLRCLWRARRAGRILHSREAGEWVFPAATQKGHIAEHKEKRHLLSHWGGDLRQTWRTAAQIVGLSDIDASLLMNHSLGSVNAGYITSAALRDHLRACQERVSRHILAAIR